MLDPGVRGTREQITEEGCGRSLRLYPAGEGLDPTGERPEHNVLLLFNILAEKVKETQRRGH